MERFPIRHAALTQRPSDFHLFGRMKESFRGAYFNEWLVFSLVLYTLCEIEIASPRSSALHRGRAISISQGACNGTVEIIFSALRLELSRETNMA